MSDFDYSQFEEAPEPGKSGNRTFAIIASILGAIILLALVAAAAYAIFIMPEQKAQQADLASKISAENTATVMAATQDAMLIVLPTDTPVPAVVEGPTEEPAAPAVEEGTGGELPEDLAMTATVSALLTQAAGVNPDAVLPAAEATATPERAATIAPTPAALPTTGFADEMGLPALVGLAFLFISVILITRQVRAVRTN